MVTGAKRFLISNLHYLCTEPTEVKLTVFGNRAKVIVYPESEQVRLKTFNLL